MANEIEQLAEQHGMTVEFVAWFFSEKKASCGNVWFMMMAAMWEGWKGRETESTAALATIEKCREIVGCPDGIDLQDHLRQLAAENMGLKEQVRALAEDNSALINSSVCALQDGRPPHGFYASEWFIAKLKNGEYAALKALPEEYSYDYRTNDGTYYTKDWVVGWMQTPDTEYRPNVKTPATDRIYAGIKADGVEKLTDRLQKHLDEGDFSANEVGVIAGAIHCGREMAQQLREGAK